MDRTRTLTLPEELCQLAEQKFARRFGNLNELVTALLNQLVRDDSLRLDEREQRIIEERLKELGYV